MSPRVDNFKIQNDKRQNTVKLHKGQQKQKQLWQKKYGQLQPDSHEVPDSEIAVKV